MTQNKDGNRVLLELDSTSAQHRTIRCSHFRWHAIFGCDQEFYYRKYRDMRVNWSVPNGCGEDYWWGELEWGKTRLINSDEKRWRPGSGLGAQDKGQWRYQVLVGHQARWYVCVGVA